jgi:hypothetical protein
VKCPLPSGTPIDAKRFRRWVRRFGSYRAEVTTITIESWIKQFKKRDRDLAARVLDAVEFYGQSQISAAYRQALASLPGWHRSPSQRGGQWRFTAMSGGSGQSGDAMLHQFRVANCLDAAQSDGLFVSRSDLFRQPMLPETDPQKLGKNDVVVFLDDFSGTGQQVCDAWNDPVTSFGALLAGVGKVYLILVAASKQARQRISRETTIVPVPAHELHEADDVFSDRCRHFTPSDQVRLLHYGEIADTKQPRGFGNCGLLVVLQHRTPNNSIPILHADHHKWTGLFPRHEK